MAHVQCSMIMPLKMILSVLVYFYFVTVNTYSTYTVTTIFKLQQVCNKYITTFINGEFGMRLCVADLESVCIRVIRDDTLQKG